MCSFCECKEENPRIHGTETMKQNTQMVTERLDASRRIIDTIHSNLDVITQRLTERAVSHDILGSEHIDAFLHLQIEHLQQLSESMRTLDMAYVTEQDDDVSLRGKLAEAGIELDRKLRLTRDSIRDLDSHETLQIYGMADRPPRARHALVAYADRIIQLLRAHPYQFSGEIGQVIDTRKVASVIEESLQPFKNLVDQMNREMNDLQEALRARNQAIDDWTDAYQGVCHCFEGLFRLVGLRRAAKLLTPTYHRTVDIPCLSNTSDT